MAKKKTIKKAPAKLKPSPIELFLRALTELYPKDCTRPGLVMSCLGTDFYASAVRYENNDNQLKQVLCAAHGATPKEAVEALIVEWHGKTQHARALVRGVNKATEPWYEYKD